MSGKTDYPLNYYTLPNDPEPEKLMLKGANDFHNFINNKSEYKTIFVYKKKYSRLKLVKNVIYSGLLYYVLYKIFKI